MKKLSWYTDHGLGGIIIKTLSDAGWIFWFTEPLGHQDNVKAIKEQCWAIREGLADALTPASTGTRKG